MAEDRAFPLRQTERDGKPSNLWYRPAARYITDAAAQQPKLAVDIVPTAEAGQFRVVHNGKPMPEAEVQVFASTGWEKGFKADERNTAGAAEKYDVIYYATTLTFVKQ